ncbi:hypothetical protein H5410_020354 [Solanum commersonii]|uniref:Uncharacterized protein n=1 Tax=Solanum commersonii TaxID=4109 RepID=A0A9J5Z875_SOLCO|nr:hypothetical protein H5410_020354 [Solanum commersonii]
MEILTTWSHGVSKAICLYALKKSPVRAVSFQTPNVLGILERCPAITEIVKGNPWHFSTISFPTSSNSGG